MIIAVGLTVSKMDRGQRSERSGHNETDYNSLNIQFRTILYTVELECILNGLPWRRLALSICWEWRAILINKVECLHICMFVCMYVNVCMYVCLFVCLLSINSAPLQSTSHLIHTLNQHDLISALVHYLFVLTVCSEVRLWRKLQNDNRKLVTVHVHWAMLEKQTKSGNWNWK